ncbi:MAG: PLP-dependent aminotransferase family protein [Gammaproteobacteria bacterium]|nr:MAG: PLP-dependent aminotransferase family protein [Gammaproteobacteria bacterium]
MDPLFEIELELPAKGSRDAARSLFEQLKAAILDRRLTAGAKLPPTRKSADFFGVSRNTASEIYDRLLHEGYVVTRHGAGTYVAETLSPHAPSPATARDAEPPDPRLNPFWLRAEVSDALGFWRDHGATATLRTKTTAIDFRPALVDSRLFPFDVFRRVSAKQLRGLERKPARFKSPQGNQGNYHLRAAIGKHIALTRAVVCAPEDVLVTAGAQQAFDLIARVLVTPGETVVAIEDPGYPPMRVPFAAAGAKLVPVGIDEEGLIVDALPADVRVICVCPSHQFPLGVTMSARRRRALVEFARARGAVIVEDDYDGEFRFGTSALAALRTADAADVVFYVGTFSKCMLPSLRLGFIVAPPWALRTLIAAKNGLDWHCAVPVQLGVAAFIAEGHLTHHVRKMRAIYQRRRQLLLRALHEDFARWLEAIPSDYGMHIAASVRGSPDLDAIAERLRERQVKLHTFGRYFCGPATRHGLVFGCGAVDLPEMRRGLAVLREALSA